MKFFLQCEELADSSEPEGPVAQSDPPTFSLMTCVRTDVLTCANRRFHAQTRSVDRLNDHVAVSRVSIDAMKPIKEVASDSATARSHLQLRPTPLRPRKSRLRRKCDHGIQVGHDRLAQYVAPAVSSAQRRVTFKGACDAAANTSWP